MASRYVLLEFDDHTSAEKLMGQINDATRKGRPYRVVGYFAKPTQFCQCGIENWTTSSRKQSTTKRGRRYGWWVCTVCKRPTASESGLANLIAPSDIINPQRFDLKNGVGELINYVLALSSVHRKA
jgi:hypothetical protein